MSTILKILILGVALLISLFIVWKRLREDYQDSEVFSLSLGIIGGALVGYIGASFLTPYLGDVRFWGAVIGGVGSGVWLTKKTSIRFFEALEAATPAVFVFLMFEALNISLTSLSRFEVAQFAVFIQLGIVILVFIYLAKNFRHFMWYPSGKIGIASMTATSLFFLSRALLANLTPGVLTWSSVWADTILGVAGTIVCLVVIYKRSGRNKERDFGFFGSLSRRKR